MRSGAGPTRSRIVSTSPFRDTWVGWKITQGHGNESMKWNQVQRCMCRAWNHLPLPFNWWNYILIDLSSQQSVQIPPNNLCTICHGSNHWRSRHRQIPHVMVMTLLWKVAAVITVALECESSFHLVLAPIWSRWRWGDWAFYLCQVEWVELDKFNLC